MTTESTEVRALRPLDALVGTWSTEATHPMLPDTVRGRAEFEWLEGGHYLIHRARADHPDVPNSISIIGVTAERLSMHYFDSRGVERIYQLSLDNGIWKMWRDVPGFEQRFRGTFDEDGNTISGLWELCRDGSNWTDDLEIQYQRI